MKKDITYKEVTFTVEFADPDGDWGENSGKFIAVGGIVKFASFVGYDEAVEYGKKCIDDWLSLYPKDWDGWVDLFDSCLHWYGYEDCELDKDRLRVVVDKYVSWKGAGGNNVG